LQEARKLIGEKRRKTIEKRFGLKKTADNLLGIFNSVIDKPIKLINKTPHNY